MERFSPPFNGTGQHSWVNMTKKKNSLTSAPIGGLIGQLPFRFGAEDFKSKPTRGKPNKESRPEDQIMRRLAPGLPSDAQCPKGCVVGAAWVKRSAPWRRPGVQGSRIRLLFAEMNSCAFPPVGFKWNLSLDFFQGAWANGSASACFLFFLCFFLCVCV